MTNGPSPDTARLRILFLSAFFPSPAADSAGVLDAFHILRELAQTHEVTLLSFATESDRVGRPTLEKLCREVFVEAAPAIPGRLSYFVQTAKSFLSPLPAVAQMSHSADMVAAIRRVRSQRAFDLAVVEFTQMAHYIEYLRGIPAILDESDIAFVRRHRFAATTRPPLRWLLRWDTRKLRSYELEHARRFDAILVRTEHDRRFLEGLLPGKRIQVLPPWVDCSFAGQTNGVPLRDVILFYGAMWRPVNEQAAQFLAEKVLPHVRQRRPDVQLVILGSRPGLRVRNLAGRNVVVTGFVPDVSAHYRQCCVAVIPLLSGSGIKGKVVQALACGKPVVTTSVGAEGIPATEEDGLFIRDSAQSIAACVSWLLEDRRYLNYQQPARRFFRKYYDWPGGVRRLLDLCEDLRVS